MSIQDFLNLTELGGQFNPATLEKPLFDPSHFSVVVSESFVYNGFRIRAGRRVWISTLTFEIVY